jgi:single-stranded-DNA-specific exonuclease
MSDAGSRRLPWRGKSTVEGAAGSSVVMRALEPTHRWRLRPAVEIDAATLDGATRAGMSHRLARLLAGRGIASAAELAGFLAAPDAGLHDPALLPDSEQLTQRIELAVERGERVLVVGDFDADGLAGLAILTIALRAIGLDTAPYVPNRLHEGHGLSHAAVARAREERRTVIVTVDCGTSSAAEVDEARAARIDVVVTDHHRLPPRTPDATALVNVHRPDSRYPDRNLAGSGVAFKIAQLLLADGRRGGTPADGRADDALALADLAAIGTVADVAPLVGENRSIVRLGLARIRSGERPGIAALLRTARIDPDALDVETIAFHVAPRLNAVGRLGDAIVAARLLLSDDPAECDALAAELEAANLARRELLEASLVEARDVASRQGHAGAIVLAGPWPVGIVGLIASRIAEETGVPAVVLSTVVVPWRGSARSANGCDVGAAFAACDDLFERYGGHAAAAGCSLAADRFTEFRRRFGELAGAPPADRRPELVLDLALGAAEIDYRLYRELASLAPTGAGNPPAIVGVEGLLVTRARAVASGHTQITLRKGIEVLDAIAFRRPDLVDLVEEGSRIDVAARLASRSFGGYESLQLEVLDAAPAGHLAAIRTAGLGERRAETNAAVALAARGFVA